MITVAIEEIYAATILSFCENLAELGCPKDAEPDMWFRYLSTKEQINVAAKLIDIEERMEARLVDTTERDVKRLRKPTKKTGKKAKK